MTGSPEPSALRAPKPGPTAHQPREGTAVGVQGEGAEVSSVPELGLAGAALWEGTGASPPSPERAPFRGHAVRLVRLTIGLVLGALSAAVELLALVVAVPGILGAAVRAEAGRPLVLPRPVAAVGAWLFRLERGRLARFLASPETGEPPPARMTAYLAGRVPVGLMGGVILAMIGLGLAVAGRLAAGWWITGDHLDGVPPEPWIVAYVAIAGLILLFLAVSGLAGVVLLERRLLVRAVAPSPAEAYRRRIEHLSASRAEVVEAIDDERRRIERDLHDGVQQRLVALGLLIGRARRAGDAERAAELLAQAHDETRGALADLREVTWRVYPEALDRDGLRAALETVVERSPVPVGIDFAVDGTPPRAVASAAYFVVCEAVTNAAKHAIATQVTVTVRGDGDAVRVRVADDGRGGADPSGAGLSGLARRVSALDGTFSVRSPAGGPTEVSAELPCG